MQGSTFYSDHSEKIYAGSLFFSICIYFLLFIQRFSFYVIDDAYIHLRIARHIVDHGQPYFNLNEPVLGSSPHLWNNTLALFLRLFDGQIDFIPYLSWVFVIGILFCLTLLLKELYTLVISIAVSGLVVALLILPATAGLMETPMAIFLFLITFVFLKKKKFLFMGVAAGLTVGVRFEYLAFLTLAFFFLPDKYSRIRYSMGLLAPLLIFLAYCVWYFGTIVPFPALSKPIVFNINLVEFFIENPTTNNFLKLSYVLSIPQRFYLAITTQVILFSTLTICIYRKSSHRTWPTLMFIFSLALYTVYLLKGVYLFSWYIPLFTVPLVISLLLISPKKYLFLLVPLFLASFLGTTVIGTLAQVSFLTGQDKFNDEFIPGWRVQQYLKIGQMLHQKYPDAALMTGEIGAISWTFPGKILDGAALVSPEILKYHPLQVPADRQWNTAGAIPAQAVKDFLPELIVTMPTFGRAVQREIESGALPYQLIDRYPIIPDDHNPEPKIKWLWGSSHIYIYKRNDYEP